MREDWSYGELANFTHTKQVEEFNFCLCEEQKTFLMRIVQERSNMPIQMIVYMIIFGVGVLTIIGGLAYLSLRLEDYLFNK